MSESQCGLHAEVLLPPQVLADACLDLNGLGDELRVEVKRGKGVCFSGTQPDSSALPLVITHVPVLSLFS
jgi:hypothetical protein